MQEIKLKVQDEHLETVLTILNNLKSGLINHIESTDKINSNSQYQPKLNTIIREENSGTADKSGKYLSPSSYKRKSKKDK